MGTAILKIKVLSEQGSDLKEIEEKIREKIASVKGKVENIEEKDVAFSIKSLIATIIWPEEQETSLAEKAISEIKGVSSLDIIDYRRAFG